MDAADNRVDFAGNYFADSYFAGNCFVGSCFVDNYDVDSSLADFADSEADADI